MLEKFFASLLLPAALLFCGFFPSAANAADDIISGGYIFEEGQTVEGPNAFVILDPSSDTIRFEQGAVLDTEVSFDLENLREQWQLWRLETGADPAMINQYDLKPLSAITVGNDFHKVILEKDAQVLNWAGLGDGLMTLGSGEVDIGEGAKVHGRWAAVSLANLEEPENDAFFTVSLTNRGSLGYYVEDVITGPLEDPPIERPARFGILMYEGVEAHIVNEATGVIKGEHTGILTNYREQEEDAPYTPPSLDRDPIEPAPGRSFALDNHGKIIGELYGVYEGGRLADVVIVNHETGLIEGVAAGIYLLRGGEVVNHGTIQGEETGIFISSGTVTITHSGAFSLTGEEPGDAIRFGLDAEGGIVTLHSSVDGGIAHFGKETEEAVVFLEDAQDASVGNVFLGEGSIIQNAGTWSMGNAAAGLLDIRAGRLSLGEVDVDIAGDLNVRADAVLNVTGGKVSAENFLNRGTLEFHDGEIAIDGGAFDHADAGGLRDFTLAGNRVEQNPHLRLINGAGTSGINTFSIGGTRAGSLTLEDDAVLSFQDRLELNNQGRLGGTGTVRGSVDARSGATLRPGHEDDPTGRLFIDGDLSIDRGVTIDIGIDRDNEGEDSNASIHASGDVTVDGGIVQVTDYSGFRVQDGTSYTFLTTDSALTGTFDAIHSFSQVYEVDLDYWARGASFTLTRLAYYDEYVQTQNQSRALNALEAAWADGHLDDLRFYMDSMLDNVLRGNAPVSNLQSVLASLDPEPYQASFRITADQVGQMSRHLMHGARQSRQKLVTGTPEELAEMMRASVSRPGSLPSPVEDVSAAAAENSRTLSWIHPGYKGTSTWDKPFRLFYGGFYRFAEVDPDVGRTGYDYKNRGFYLGFERPRCSRIVSGVSLGYTYSFAKFDDKRGELAMDSFRLGPHVTYTLNNLEVDIAASGGVHLSRQEREMIPIKPYRLVNRRRLPAKPEVAVSRFNVYDGSVYTDARYKLLIRDVWQIVPSAGLHYIYQYREGLKESRAGDINLRIEQDTFHTLRGTAGLNLRREVRGGRFVLVPELFGGWRYDMLDQGVDVKGWFINATRSPDQSFRVKGDGPDRETVVVGAGITALFGEYNVAYAGYEREITDTGNVETLSAGVKWNF